jgi:hypothetical protein
MLLPFPQNDERWKIVEMEALSVWTHKVNDRWSKLHNKQQRDFNLNSVGKVVRVTK